MYQPSSGSTGRDLEDLINLARNKVSAWPGPDRQEFKRHAELVSHLAYGLGEELYRHASRQFVGFTFFNLQLLKLGALLHDLGENLPPSVRIVDRPLTDEEKRLIREHPERGQRMLIGTALIQSDYVRSCVVEHHEDWNGGGYPNRLAGADISIFGRIVRVADRASALRTPRGKRRALNCEAARRRLQREAGETLDPDLVQAFLQTNLLERLTQNSPDQPLV